MRKLLIITLLPLLGAALFGSGCTPENQCQYQWTEYCAFGVPACTPESSINDVPDGGPPCCAGHLVNATTWESGPLFGTWLDYSHNKNIHMHLRDAVTGAQLTGDIINITGYPSPVAAPNSPGGQFSGGAGNLGEFFVAQDGTTPGWTLDIHNDSCADYFVWVVVTSVPSGDASADGAIGPIGDAGDASSE